MAGTSSPGNSLWSAQAQMPSIERRQIVVERGDGAYLTTTAGQRLFDGSAGLWHTSIGHGRPEMAEAAAEQIRRLETWHVFGRFANDRAIELTDRLSELSPIEDPRIILNSGGSDADDLACKLARHYWQITGRPAKRYIVSRQYSYHGLHAYGTSVAGLDFNREGFGPSLVPETLRVSPDDIVEVERQIMELGPENIAAFIAEPILGAGGVYPPKPGYLEGIQRICDEYDILFILDEVITGFGRTGHMFATERYGLRPDIITVAKGLTSGYAPMGGVFVSPRVWEPYFSRGEESHIFRHGVTYSGHATGSALALKNLQIIEDEGLVARAGELEAVLSDELDALARHELVDEVRHEGFLGAIQFTDRVGSAEIADELIDRGYVLRPLNGNALQASPPFIVTDLEIKQLIGAVRETLDGHL
ncbi:aminotransferase family protein [Leucobacter celer]|uniref:aminotransferase family protein n=1 Tax=Leucobacter celer TaxID=668625 RepID=UPI0009F9866E|nr:aspartate aminotransferase family protein [Leucobacter celer]